MMERFVFVVVNFNGGDRLFSCVSSIRNQEAGAAVVIVDNGSTDGSSGKVSCAFPGTVVIRNAENRGFAAGLNAGIRRADGEYIVALNSDVELAPDFIAILKEKAAGDGMISPLILGPDGGVDSRGVFIGKWLHRFYDARDRVCASKVLGPKGACAVFSRKFLESVRLGDEYFDEDFFLIAEDIDLAWRARLLGWRNRHVPELRCRHEGGFSTGKSELARFLALRNRYLLLIKNGDWRDFLALACFAPFYDLPRLAHFMLTNRGGGRLVKEMPALAAKMAVKRGQLRLKMKGTA
ncbi:MAG: glycosyltransferase family 2 protein [Deltaproteobacteria bacterium]